MSNQRFIHCVGTSDEDTSHIRLLLRLARTRVRDNWTWGSESTADLVIVDTHKVVGDTALRRAGQRGIACARIIEAQEPTPSDQYLRKPLQRDAFANLLAKVEGSADAEPETAAWDNGMAELDLGLIDLSALEANHPGAQRGYGPPSHAGETREDLELVGIADLSAHLIDLMAIATPGAGAEPPHIEASSADEESHAHVEEVLVPRAAIDPDATFPLVYYLEKGVLEGPSRIALPRRLPLVIDPDAQMFWAQDSLPVLEPYVREPLRYGDWERLDGMKLENARVGMATRPFTRLIWLDAFIHSNGFLAKRYDMGGNFRLTHRIDLSDDYPHAFRVTGCMIGAPRKLHEIARVSAVGLEQVFDIINAYDALGYVEGTRR